MAGDRWLYRQDVCDGGPCICDCNHCDKSDAIFALEAMEAEMEEEMRGGSE